MHPVISQSGSSEPPAARRLVENGPRKLELLFRAIVYQPTAPILLADNDRNYREASTAAGRPLGLPREKIIGRKMDDFADPSSKPQISELWRTFLEMGEHEGMLYLKGLDGRVREVGYTAKGNVLPAGHLLVLHEKATSAGTAGVAEAKEKIPGWVQDYALFLLDAGGRILTWNSGAERIYGYAGDEAILQNQSFLYPTESGLNARLQEVLKTVGSGRPLRKRMLAGEEGRFAILGQCPYDGD